MLIESLAGIGAGNVAIEGNLYDGYTVEFINALAGKPVTDITAAKICRDIANAFEQQLTYPGEIKVSVIRETRVIEYAR